MAERCRAKKGFFSLTCRDACSMFLLCSIRGGGRGVCVSGIGDRVSGIRVGRGKSGCERKERDREKCLLLFRQFCQFNQDAMRNSCLLLSTGSKKPVEQNQGLSRKHVYFCPLLHTFHVWLGQVLFGINGLNATDA
jgi:hypothetical protein